MLEVDSPFLELLRDRIDLRGIPFTDRGSRLLLFHGDEGFRLRMAERWFKQDRQLSSYRQRSPLIDGWLLTDGDGTPLELEVVTHPHRIECRTRIGTFTIAFLDEETIIVGLPQGRCGLTFRVRMDAGQRDRRGGVLWLTGEIRRHLAYTSNAPLTTNEIHALEPEGHEVRMICDADEGDRAITLNLSPRLGYNRSVPSPAKVLVEAALSWHAWFAAAPEVAECYREQYYYCWWVMRAGIISPRYYTTREAMTPSKIHYVGVWQWDAFFHAMAYRHVDARLAQDQIRIVLNHQRHDGMLPDAVHDEGTVTHLDFPVDADVTKPPLVAWAAWKIHEVCPDRDFLDEIYEPLVRWNAWWRERNDLDHNGLSEYRHPFSSGLDDSPMWDDGVPVEAPDLATYLCMQMDALARIAGVIGEADDALKWSQFANEMAAKLVEARWDESEGLFWPWKEDRPIRVKTPFSLFPLITGRMPQDVAFRLVDHLVNTNEFWPAYPVPTVALDDPRYTAGQMWRGPTWVNVNYLLIEGLVRSGFTETANELRRRTLDLVCRHRDVYEFYDPLDGSVPPKAAPIFGWTAALFIDLAIDASREAAL